MPYFSDLPPYRYHHLPPHRQLSDFGQKSRQSRHLHPRFCRHITGLRSLLSVSLIPPFSRELSRSFPFKLVVEIRYSSGPLDFFPLARFLSELSALCTLLAPVAWQNVKVVQSLDISARRDNLGEVSRRRKAPGSDRLISRVDLARIRRGYGAGR